MLAPGVATGLPVGESEQPVSRRAREMAARERRFRIVSFQGGVTACGVLTPRLGRVIGGWGENVRW
jgi:hypothetical protein